MTTYNPGRVTQSRRIARVMFVYGYSEAEARIFLHGWTKGRRATNMAYKRAGGVQMCRPRVGGPAWEQEQG